MENAEIFASSDQLSAWSGYDPPIGHALILLPPFDSLKPTSRTTQSPGLLSYWLTALIEALRPCHWCLLCTSPFPQDAWFCFDRWSIGHQEGCYTECTCIWVAKIFRCFIIFSYSNIRLTKIYLDSVGVPFDRACFPPVQLLVKYDNFQLECLQGCLECLRMEYSESR